MQHQRFLIMVGIMGLAVVGASCSSSTTVSVQNTNVTINANAAVLNTNSVTTGSFVTGQTEQASTVTITSTGVSPQTLTVKQGTVVTFLNHDTSIHQIASNPHPTHTDLPGLNGTIPVNDQYTFTFDQAGRWGYHDHLNPLDQHFQGTVVVE